MVRRRGEKQGKDWKLVGNSLGRDVRSRFPIFGKTGSYKGKTCIKAMPTEKTRATGSAFSAHATPEAYLCSKASCQHAHSKLEQELWNLPCPFGSSAKCEWGQQVCPMLHNDEQKNFRTTVCSFYAQGKCDKGDLCEHFHDPELGKVNPHSPKTAPERFNAASLYRTKPCNDEGFCVHGSRCSYWHSDHEEWTKSNPPYRFTECAEFVETGTCSDKACELFHAGEHSTNTINNPSKKVRPTHFTGGPPTGWDDELDRQFPDLLQPQRNSVGWCQEVALLSGESKLPELKHHLQHILCFRASTHLEGHTKCPHYRSDLLNSRAMHGCFFSHLEFTECGQSRRPVIVVRDGVAMLAYSSKPCRSYVDYGRCPDGDSCMYSHGPLERSFHPFVYKTQHCVYYGDRGTRRWNTSCTAGIHCSHAHGERDLRSKSVNVWHTMRTSSGHNEAECVDLVPSPASSFSSTDDEIVATDSKIDLTDSSLHRSVMQFFKTQKCRNTDCEKHEDELERLSQQLTGMSVADDDTIIRQRINDLEEELSVCEGWHSEEDVRRPPWYHGTSTTALMYSKQLCDNMKARDAQDALGVLGCSSADCLYTLILPKRLRTTQSFSRLTCANTPGNATSLAVSASSIVRLLTAA